MIKAMIFDLDGVIIDSEIMYYEFYKKIIENNVNKDFLLQEYVENCCGSSLEHNVDYIISNYSLNITYEEIKEKLIKEDRTHIERGYKLKKGVNEILLYLKENNIKIVLATSSTKERALRVLKSKNLDIYFDVIVGADDVKRAKPYPDIFLKASEKIKMSPEECIVIEDSESGLKSSLAANIPVICVPDLKKPNPEYLNKTLKTFESLIEVVEYLETEKKYGN